MVLDRNAVTQEVPIDPETGKPYLNTVAVTWQGMNNQILQQADPLNGISQFADGLRRIRHRAHIQW